MKNTARIMVFLLMASIGVVAQQKAGVPDTGSDEAAIRANVEQMVIGWNTKSGASYAKPFAEDSDYVVINGLHIKGRTANAAVHQRIFDTVYKTSVLASMVEQIRFLRPPDVAVVHVLARLSLSGEPAEAGNARVTLVMTKNKDKWEIAVFQNTQIQTAEGGR